MSEEVDVIVRAEAGTRRILGNPGEVTKHAVKCPACATRPEIGESRAGREVSCPTCNAHLSGSVGAEEPAFLKNSIGMTLALIPAGQFDMGTRESVEE